LAAKKMNENALRLKFWNIDPDSTTLA